MHHNRVVHSRPTRAETPIPAEIPVLGDSEGVPLLGRDRPLILALVSSSCRYCLDSAPAWRELTGELESMPALAPDFIFLSVSPWDETHEFLRASGIEAPFYLIDPSVLPLLGAPGYPTTIGIGVVGTDVARWIGAVEAAEVAAISQWARARAVPEIR